MDKVIHVGEWPGISDLFLLSLGREGMTILQSIFLKNKGKMLYREILEKLLNEALISHDKARD